MRFVHLEWGVNAKRVKLVLDCKTRSPSFYEKMSWRKILIQEQACLLEWIEANAPLGHLKDIAQCLRDFLINRIRDPESTRLFWEAIPLVRYACNVNQVYEQPYAVEAYAYVHLLDRYWRTWEALLELTRKAALPLGKEGVRILDIGTGPAPTPYAIQDYYALLREYGHDKGLPELVHQEVSFSIVENSPSMAHFMHLFSEYCGRPGPFGADIIDFKHVNPREERQRLFWRLRNAEFYDPESGEYYDEYLPEEANFIAQRHQRYRMMIFSNFFTTERSVEEFREPLSALLSDARPGTVVLIIGARSSHYPEIYRQLTTISEQSGFQQLFEIPEILKPSQRTEQVQSLIKRIQFEVFAHLNEIIGNNLPKKLQCSDYRYVESAAQSQWGIQFPGSIKWPDYWSPQPNPKKRLAFAIRIYRKGKWKSLK